MSIVSTKERLSSGLRRGRLTVPWKTVLPLAVVLAYADGFWLMSLRGAVGAIERNQTPFASWVRESTVVLPVFVLAVLAAVTLAVRWFGPVLRTTKALAATVLLIVAAGTLVGLAQIVANAAYDYHLQTEQLQLMEAMHDVCTTNCLGQQEHATLALHVQSVVYVSRWLLLTNVLLVGWLVAMWGGRLKVSTTGRQPVAAPDALGVVAGSRVDDVRRLLVLSLVATAVLHAALVPAHLTQWAGIFLLLFIVWELAAAGMILARLEERGVLLATAAISFTPLALWFTSRTFSDALAALLEIASLAAAVVLLRSTRWLARPPASAHVRALVLTALVAVTVIGIAAAGLSWLDPFTIPHGTTVMHMLH